jgi:hypothetical protein
MIKLGYMVTGVLMTTALLAGRAAPAVAAEVDVKTYWGLVFQGSVFPMEEGRYFWVGQSAGAMSDLGANSIFHNASAQCPQAVESDAAANVQRGNGVCIITTMTGDKVFATWSCEGSASPKHCEGPFTITSGTGELAGITGGGTLRGGTLAMHPDQKVSGYTEVDFRFTLPQTAAAR